MTQERPTPPPPSRPGGRSETWRHERMVQRVPAHLGENESRAVSPWIMAAGIVLLMLVLCAVLFIVLGGGSRFGFGVSATVTPTRPARTVTPNIITIPVTAVPTTGPTPGPTPVTVKYKVKSGDSLIEIAARYKVTVQAIKTANNLRDDTIRVGDELIIPLPTPTPPPTVAPPPATPTPQSMQSPPNAASPVATPGVIRHIVKRGDTLIGIAGLYSSTVEAIRAANQMDSDFLSVGQEILVPIGAWTPTPTPAPIVNRTATPTTQFAYAQPNLLSPGDNAVLRGKTDTPMLSWTSPGILKPNEYYVVHIEYVAGAEKKVLPSLTVRQSTSVKLDASYYQSANPEGKYFWYVMVVSQATGTRTQTATLPIIATSPPSPTWSFAWY